MITAPPSARIIAITMAACLLALALAPSRDLVLPVGALAAGAVLLWNGYPTGLVLAAAASIAILALHFAPGTGTLIIVVAALTLSRPLTAPRWPVPDRVWLAIATAAPLAAIGAPSGMLGTALLGVTLLSLGAHLPAITIMRGAGCVMLMAIASAITHTIGAGADALPAALLWLIGGAGYALITLETGPRAALAPVAALALLWRWHPAGLPGSIYTAFGLILVLSGLALFALRPRWGLRSPWSCLAVAQIGVIIAAAGLDFGGPTLCLPIGFAMVQLWRACNPESAWALLALAGFPPFALFVGDAVTLQALRTQSSGIAFTMALALLTMAMIALIRLRGVRL
jgi:hypothetical protein